MAGMSDVKQELHHLFEEHAELTGGLCIDDFKAIFKEVGLELTESAVDEFWSELAGSKDERISSMRFLGHLYGESMTEQNPVCDQEPEFDEATLRQVFVIFDNDGSGTVSVDAFAKALKDGAHTIVNKMPVLSTLEEMFGKSPNSAMDFSEFHALADALNKAEVSGVPRTCVIKLASQFEDINARFDDEGEVASWNDAVLRRAFAVFCRGKPGGITYAEVAEFILQAAHGFIDQMPIASAVSVMMGKHDQNFRFEFDEFRRMAEALAKGELPALPNLDVVTLSPTSKRKPNIKESLLASRDE